ncbi:MAG TPA: hypothetical protein VHG93_01815 [Longimicrobium sp.]|nr:hypothetical protein [Longimicrobium sp.]
MTGPPRQYAEWAAALDRFAGGDDACIDAMERGTLEWTAVVAERFTQRLHDAFSARLRDAQRRLGRQLDAARGDEARLAQALIGARHLLAPLARVTRLAALPEPLRTHLVGELARMASTTQQSLEQSARADRHRGERLLAVVLRTPIRVPGDADPACAAPNAAPSSTGGRRPIILP